jgi:hypothetical protein
MDDCVTVLFRANRIGTHPLDTFAWDLLRFFLLRWLLGLFSDRVFKLKFGRDERGIVWALDVLKTLIGQVFEGFLKFGTLL